MPSELGRALELGVGRTSGDDERRQESRGESGSVRRGSGIGCAIGGSRARLRANGVSAQVHEIAAFSAVNHGALTRNTGKSKLSATCRYSVRVQPSVVISSRIRIT